MWLSDLGLCLRAVRKEAGSKTKLKRRKKKEKTKKQSMRGPRIDPEKYYFPVSN